MKAVLFVVLLAFAASTDSNAVTIAKGFFYGLQVNPSTPSACYQDTPTIIQYGEAIATDLTNIAAEVDGAKQQLLTDALAASKFFVDNETDCDWAPLITKL